MDSERRFFDSGEIMKLPYAHQALAFVGIFLFSGVTQAIDVAIGWIGPAQRLHAISLQQGAQLGVDEANQRNIVVNGQKLVFKLLVFDDHDNPNLAVNAANSLVAAKAVAVIGHFTSATTNATTGIYADAGIPEITVFATGPSVTQRGFKNIFQLIGSATISPPYMAEALFTHSGARRVAMAYIDSSMGSSMADAMEQEGARRGNRLAGRIAISPLTSDFNDILSMLKNKPSDVLLFAGVQQQAEALSRRLKQAGLHTRLLLTGGAFNMDFFVGTGNYDDGTLIMLDGKPEKQLPGFAKFEKAYSDRFRVAPMPYAVNAYDAVNVIIRAIQSSNSLTPRTLTDTLHATTFDGVTGKIAFDRTGRLLNQSYTLYRAEQGKWKPVRVFP
jgi:branched-chain amino acid transport system substrate-binding protein